MLSTLKAALISAVPLELINFFIVGYPADSRSVSTASQHPAVALQWYIFHLPGIIASDRSDFLRKHDRVDSLVLFVAGYLTTALFLVVVLWGVHLVLATVRRLSFPLKPAH
jgi:hypothetical protein